MLEIHRWQHQYLGMSTFPKVLSAVEIQAFFTFNESELGSIRSRYKSNLRIAAAVQLGFLKMTGCPLAAVRVIPARLLRHISGQLNVPALTIASLRAIYQREKTLYEHQWWAMETLGFSKAKPAQLRWLLPFLRQEARHVTSVDGLVERGRLWLYQHRFISVADRVIRDYARTAMAESEDGLFRLIREQVPETVFRQLEAAVLKNYGDTGRSTLEWLQQPPRRRSAPALRERLDQVEFLKGLRLHELNLDGIPIEKIRVYAADLYNMRPYKYRQLKDPTRTLRLVCFLKMALMQAVDTAILMSGRQVSKIVRGAYDKARLLEAESSMSYRETVGEIFKLVDDQNLSDQAFRDHVRKLKQGHQPPQFQTRAAAARWILSGPNPAIRSLLNELQKLDLKAEEGNPTSERLDYLRSLYQKKDSALPETPTVSYPSAWSSLIEGADRERAMRALEAATLVGLRKSLRSGAVFVDYSEKFRGRKSLLIDDERWAKEKAKRYAQLNLPLNGNDLVDRLVADLEQKLQAVDVAITAEKITVQDGTIHLPRVKALVPRPDVEKKRDAMFAKIGVVQLPDLILQIDCQTGFSKAILGRPAKNDTELLQVYAGMLAHGTSLDASGVSLMIPQLRPSQITAGMQYFEDREATRAANDAVISFQRRLPIASAWGDGSLASCDMMSLDVSRQIWAARLDPKRKVASVGSYTHVSDFWSIIYDQPIVLNERQAGAAIEGAIRQTEVDVDRLAVDTHGYTEFAMSIAKLLGFALCPRLARLSERRLYVPQRMENIPSSLSQVIIPSVSLNQIRQNLDDLVRVAASIETGHATATVALARFGSASSDSPIYRAGVHLGRSIRSIYLCDYFLSEELRRTINRILVHGEAVHQLQRAINAGNFSKPRGQREEELFAMSGSLTLISNLCLAWTAMKMQDLVEGDGGVISADDLDWLQYVSPAHFSNINFRGTFTFPISEYRESLLFGTKMAANG